MKTSRIVALVSTAVLALTASPAVAAPAVPQVTANGTITGLVWQDRNGNGVREPTDPLVWCYVEALPSYAGEKWGEPVAHATAADGSGRYSLSVPPGDYLVRYTCSGETTLFGIPDDESVDNDAHYARQVRLTVTSGRTTGYDIGIMKDGDQTRVGPFGDKSADGLADLYMSEPKNGQIEMWTSRRDKGLRLSLALNVGAAPCRLIQMPDISGDGRSDLVSHCYDVLEINPSTPFHGIVPAEQRRYLGSHGWLTMDQVTYARSMTGTRQQHLVARRKSDGTLWRYDFSGPTLINAVQLGKGWNGMRHITSVGDFTGDGRSDLMAVRASDNTMWLYPATADGRLGVGRNIGSGWTFDMVASPGDVTGDGRHDLVVRTTTGDLRVYPNAGPMQWGAWRLVGTGFQHYRSIS